MSKSKNNSFEADGTRPIKSSEVEIVDSFEEDGERPIAKSPEFLTNEVQSEQSAKDDSRKQSKGSAAAKVSKDSNTVNSNVEVVDSFQADGERPIMASTNEVVDTLDVDGKRPITKSPDFLVNN